MKGLLIKDLKLMKNNGKNLLLVFLIIGTMMGIMTKELYAAVGYVTFIFTLFTVSTISYDEYDNGYPFLFTLPITRRQYVNEKFNSSNLAFPIQKIKMVLPSFEALAIHSFKSDRKSVV